MSSTTPYPPQHTQRYTFWLVLIAIVLLSANMRSPIVALGSIAPIIQEALNITEAHIGWLGAVPVLMFAFGSLISPAIAKRAGLENTLIASLAVLTIGVIVRSAWVGWTGFLVGTILFSLAIGFANTLGTAVIKQHTPKHIAILTSAYSLTMTLVAGAVAGVVYPLTINFGWQWALGIWAVLGLIGMMVWIVLRYQLGSSHRVGTNHAGANHATQVGATHLNTKNSSRLTHQEVSVWRSPLAWQMAVLLGLQSLLFYTIASFLPTIWVDKGLTPTEAGHMAMVFQWMAPFAIPLMTWGIRRGFSARFIVVLSTVLNVLGTFGMAYLSPDLAWIWSGLMGFGCAGIFTLCLILFSARTDSALEASRLSGMVQTVGYIIAFMGPLSAGWLHDRWQSWDVPLLMLFVLMAVNVGFGWLVGRPVMLDGRPAGTKYEE